MSIRGEAGQRFHWATGQAAVAPQNASIDGDPDFAHWLAGFTETGENDGRLWVTDFSRQRQWPTTPANAGHIRDFFRLANPAPDPVVVERFFSQLEGMVAPVFRALDTERRPRAMTNWTF